MKLAGNWNLVGHFFLAFCWYLAFGGIACSSAQDNPKPVENPEFEEILRLREEMGGIGGILKGVNSVGGRPLMETVDEEFKAELHRLYNTENPNRPSVTPQFPPASSPVPAPVVPGSVVPAPAASGPLMKLMANPIPKQRAKLVLRSVARELEALSWQLEEVEQYENADQIRELATRLRLQSRVAPESSKPNRAGHPPSLVR